MARTDGSQARAHVEELLAVGFYYSEIGHHAGVNTETVRRVHHGQGSFTKVEDKILAVPPLRLLTKVGAASAHILSLVGQGMDIGRVAEVARVQSGTINRMHKGYAGRVSDRVLNAVLGVEFEARPPGGMVSPQAMLDHVKTLTDQGMSIRSIANLAGVAYESIHRPMRGGEWVRESTAQVVMKVQFDASELAHQPVEPSSKHIERLQAGGMTLRHIASKSGVPQATLSEIRRRLRPTVNRSVALAVLGTQQEEVTHSAEKVAAHLLKLQDKGFSMSEVAKLAGVNPETTLIAARGERVQVRFEIAKRILSVDPEDGAPTSRAMVPAWPTQRRLQALYARGWPMTGQEGLGITANATAVLRGERERCSRGLALAIADLYEKYCYKNPEDHGVTRWIADRNRKVAAKRRWPSTGCWEPETLDDPDALPEWTGECGTNSGYFIHRREKIPVCEPCRQAHNERTSKLIEARPEESHIPQGFSKETLDGLLKEMSTVYRHGSRVRREDLAKHTGIAVTSIKSYRNGQAEPSRNRAHTLAEGLTHFLGRTIKFEDLYPEVDNP